MKTEIELPFNLSKLDRDRRGLPIPFVVYRDKEGTPHFTINDIHALTMALGNKLCGLCGKPHKMGKMWFIGGVGAAFHESGLFIDPPVHEECGRYAMQVCPFIAAPNYSKRIEDATLDPEKSHGGVLTDNQMDPSRPPLFIFARTSSYRLIEAEESAVYIQPRRPWKEIEYYLHGTRINKAEAAALTVADGKYLPEDLMWWGSTPSPGL